MIAQINGKNPKIDQSCFVARDADVIGDVVLGERSSIWFNSVVRGDMGKIRIGKRTNVQDLCVLHTEPNSVLTIGDDVTIGHRAIIHGCTIGNRVLIGMGAIIMNGARIGDECIIGAGALVTENTVIPSHSLVVGVPGKVKREISAEEVANLSEHAAHYAEYAARCKKEGLGV